MNIWNSFKGKTWRNDLNVRDFIISNYKLYLGDEKFLEPITDKTNKIWNKCLNLLKKEQKLKVLDIETNVFSGINNYKPGYIDKENEVIFGLQTDKPLKRIVNPYGGYKLVENTLEYYKYKLNKNLVSTFKEFRKTHNDGVFSVYTNEMRLARKNKLLTGLPDAYGRGRIIGDYRLVALYGVDKIIEVKQKDYEAISDFSSEENIKLKEEVYEQIKALNKLKEMANSYGFDISKPANTSKEAFQWVYFAYLAAIKENNGAAMSLGRVSSFLDIYIEHDLKNGIIDEKQAQELVDQFVIKLRLVRHLRTSEYDELFSGDPTWVTESLGGMSIDNKPLVTKNTFRFLHTLTNLGPSPEPNLTVLWSKNLPDKFKKYCSKMSIITNAIQYENDDLMKDIYGDDYGIACCVSAMQIGKQMQYFGARANLAKVLLYSINGGIDEITNVKVIEGIPLIKDKYLSYEKVMDNFKIATEKIAKVYVNTMNAIHYMHDKYAYEAIQMALHETNVQRLMAFGLAGLSVVADSLSAIKYAKVETIRNEDGLVIDYNIKGSFPKYGNDDDKVDKLIVSVVKDFYKEIKKNKTLRGSKPTMSILTITSNLVYGKATGATPDGRKNKEAFAPGANPMHNRDNSGALAALNSVAKLPYKNCCQDGISNTFSIVPTALGKNLDSQKNTLINILDGYFEKGGHHLNVNVLSRELLLDAYNNPQKYPLLTIRVSGYAVRFNRLTKEQQLEVISRTFHDKI